MYMYSIMLMMLQELWKFSRASCYFILFYLGVKWQNFCTVLVQEFILFYFIANGRAALALIASIFSDCITAHKSIEFHRTALAVPGWQSASSSSAACQFVSL